MIYVVGIGPGSKDCRTVAATRAISRADAIVGYRPYVDLIAPEFPEKPACTTGMKGEVERCKEALRLSRDGKTVAVVCSGDASVYGMASLILELAGPQDAVEIVPGVTAAVSASALLGAPLSGDFAVISLSDLLTPWETIEKRLRGAALGDFCMAVYNPSSKGRKEHLARAVSILLETLAEDTPCGFAQNIARKGQAHKITTLKELPLQPVDMFTTVIIGNSQTVVKGGVLLTPRGYRK